MVETQPPDAVVETHASLQLSTQLLRLRTIYATYYMQIIIGTASFLYLDPLIQR